jgi:hypothetical protein
MTNLLLNFREASTASDYDFRLLILKSKFVCLLLVELLMKHLWPLNTDPKDSKFTCLTFNLFSIVGLPKFLPTSTCFTGVREASLAFEIFQHLRVLIVNVKALLAFEILANTYVF